MSSINTRVVLEGIGQLWTVHFICFFFFFLPRSRMIIHFIISLSQGHKDGGLVSGENGIVCGMMCKEETN